jgi:phosphodiesterase/alkaline phosphatase D-like protein
MVLRFLLFRLSSFGFVAIAVALVVHAKSNIGAEAAEGVANKQLPILQGATGFNDTQLAIQVAKNAKFKFVLRDQNGRRYSPSHYSRKYRNYSEWAVDQLFYEHLPAGTKFTFEVFDVDQKLIDTRSLSTMAIKQGVGRIALISCMSDSPVFPHKQIWRALQEEDPDVIFFLGDNVYASKRDPVNPEQMWERYRQTRAALSFFYFPKLIPVFATWDDHDFGKNNGDKSYEYVREAQEIFRDFFPQRPINFILERGPGISQSLNLYGRQYLWMVGVFAIIPKEPRCGAVCKRGG